MSHFDIIGDIHGHADELVGLLHKLGYDMNKNGIFSYSDPSNKRMIIFVGDLIDRGPKIRETLQIVKNMVESGNAFCIRGNHEDNAIRFWKLDTEGGGGYQRKHNIKNIVQHFATIKAFQNKETEWKSYLEWFETLPHFLDLPDLRVVHASWPTTMPSDHMNPEDHTLNTILRGAELDLPEGYSYADKDGNIRVSARTKWWLDPERLTYQEYLEDYNYALPGLDKVKIPEELWDRLGKGYPKSAKPIFFGHYWLRGEPKIQRENVCCLDYSVAKGGSLVAYRFDGEQSLDNSKFFTQVAE